MNPLNPHQYPPNSLWILLETVEEYPTLSNRIILMNIQGDSQLIKIYKIDAYK